MAGASVSLLATIQGFIQFSLSFEKSVNFGGKERSNQTLLPNEQLNQEFTSVRSFCNKNGIVSSKLAEKRNFIQINIGERSATHVFYFITL